MSSTFLDPAALMRNVAFGLRVKVYWSAVSSRCQCVAELFADAAGGRWMRRSGGFASWLCAILPRGASLRLGTPGLYSATPLGLVWGGVDSRKVALPVLRLNILVACKAETDGLTVEKAAGSLLKMVKVTGDA